MNKMVKLLKMKDGGTEHEAERALRPVATWCA